MSSTSGEQLLRELDGYIQEWISIHQRSTSTASDMSNLYEQRTKTFQIQPPNGELLIAMQQEKIEECKRKLWKCLQNYGKVIEQLDSLDKRAQSETCDESDDQNQVTKVAGVTLDYVKTAIKDRRAQYTKEYLRRVDLLKGLLWNGRIGVGEFIVEWMESKVNYETEEDYLERLRLIRLAKQWQANQEAIAAL